MGRQTNHHPLTRRAFIQKTAAVSSGATAISLLRVSAAVVAPDAPGVALVTDPLDPASREPAVLWVLDYFADVLAAQKISVKRPATIGQVAKDDFCVLAASSGSNEALEALFAAHVSFPSLPESLALALGKVQGRKAAIACGMGVRGVVYAVLELADRVRFSPDPISELRSLKSVSQQPANRVRSIARLFASDVEDKGWFNDRSFWRRYLTELATQRFNRFSLTLGLGYDFPTDIRDAYFHFAYPFFVAVPGYNVRATPLPDSERDQNLEMLRFISQEAARRGLHFQLGLWTHAYIWENSPKANYVIEGLTPETHAPYCKAALETLLRSCPAISGVTFRIHGESGVAEGTYEFWQTLFEGARSCGRIVEIDMHAKGMDQKMVETGLATRLPLSISPKFWAEHMGLGYMQGSIRPQEMPPAGGNDRGFFSRSSGSRRFLRYGYGDLLAEDRRYKVLHRIWPGTQRLLLWGSPEIAADYGRASSFCGSVGVELCEPLSFKGRKGSGLPGGRDGYQDLALHPQGGDFSKYLYYYRLWGRCTYDPDSAPEAWRRVLQNRFGRAAGDLESAMAAAGRILPLITTAHCPSAANNDYWPEMYTNMPIVSAKRPHPYGDTLSPKRFGAVSPLDPEFFSRVDDFAQDLLAGRHNPRISPSTVAARLEANANAALASLKKARSIAGDDRYPEFRRVALDIEIQAGLGLFFAWKFRSAVLFALFEHSNHAPALEKSLECYRKARAAWAGFAASATGVYRDDITFGPAKHQRGHWKDRLPAMDDDIADMEQLLAQPAKTIAAPSSGSADAATMQPCIRAVLEAPAAPPKINLQQFHSPRATFRRGEPVLLEATLPRPLASQVSAVLLRYRRVDQAETWASIPMIQEGKVWRAEITRDYTDSSFPLQYHFEFRQTDKAAWYVPGLDNRWHAQPYYLVRQKLGA
jgi:hypothetical protein